MRSLICLELATVRRPWRRPERSFTICMRIHLLALLLSLFFYPHGEFQSQPFRTNADNCTVVEILMTRVFCLAQVTCCLLILPHLVWIFVWPCIGLKSRHLRVVLCAIFFSLRLFDSLCPVWHDIVNLRVYFVASRNRRFLSDSPIRHGPGRRPHPGRKWFPPGEPALWSLFHKRQCEITWQSHCA